ncbi:hypothetical protein N7510_003319 [Penicillium lagena]|uniref:uncharacterized protein n=1 Tax=Penicillium lagena TaxID=94218 RepID=UPI002540988E|nr:uncharacterized protein N7510_003319 [Penicillium lagena]KAJ5619335.1 hypothetical protein N7510_003319 [Penicillium lagena]
MIASKDAPVGIIDPDDVGLFAAHLLSQEDPTMHNTARYVLNRPEDITGKQIVDMVEQHIGTQVEEVSYKDMSFINLLYEHIQAPNHQSKNIVLSIKHTAEMAWEGECLTSTTSRNVLELAPPKGTPAEVLAALLKE